MAALCAAREMHAQVLWGLICLNSVGCQGEAFTVKQLTIGGSSHEDETSNFLTPRGGFGLPAGIRVSDSARAEEDLEADSKFKQRFQYRR